MENMSNKCYECQYRRDLPGSAHSKCVHPNLPKVVADNPMMEMFSILGGVGRTLVTGGKEIDLKTALPAVSEFLMDSDETSIKVKGHEHGIKNGWFMFPYNFDPTWLLECDGFEGCESCEHRFICATESPKKCYKQKGITPNDAH